MRTRPLAIVALLLIVAVIAYGFLKPKTAPAPAPAQQQQQQQQQQSETDHPATQPDANAPTTNAPAAATATQTDPLENARKSWKLVEANSGKLEVADFIGLDSKTTPAIVKVGTNQVEVTFTWVDGPNNGATFHGIGTMLPDGSVHGDWDPIRVGTKIHKGTFNLTSDGAGGAVGSWANESGYSLSLTLTPITAIPAPAAPAANAPTTGAEVPGVATGDTATAIDATDATTDTVVPEVAMPQMWIDLAAALPEGKVAINDGVGPAQKGTLHIKISADRQVEITYVWAKGNPNAGWLMTMKGTLGADGSVTDGTFTTQTGKWSYENGEWKSSTPASQNHNGTWTVGADGNGSWANETGFSLPLQITIK